MWLVHRGSVTLTRLFQNAVIEVQIMRINLDLFSARFQIIADTKEKINRVVDGYVQRVERK